MEYEKDAFNVDDVYLQKLLISKELFLLILLKHPFLTNQLFLLVLYFVPLIIIFGVFFEKYTKSSITTHIERVQTATVPDQVQH